MKHKFILLDAFTRHAFSGAQIAVFTHADGISKKHREQLSSELNLSETVFISRTKIPECDVQLDIYTPQGESPGFAGHAVLAACYAMAESGLVIDSYSRVSIEDRQFEISLGVKNKKVQIDIPVSEKYDEYVPSNTELAQIIGLDEQDIGYLEYKPMIAGCPDPFLIVPIKNNQALRSAQFNENKWQVSFVTSLAQQILLFTGDHPFNDVSFAARILGKGVALHEDPPIGAAAPALGLYLSYGKQDYHRSCMVQRGDENSRVSILEVNVDKVGHDVKKVQLGGHVVKVGEGYFDLADSL